MANPPYELPMLSDADYAALKASIKAHGRVLVAVVKDETGKVLSGHHRLRAVDELRREGVDISDPPEDIVRGLAEEEKQA